MSSAINHKKRSHRSHADHQSAARAMPYNAPVSARLGSYGHSGFPFFTSLARAAARVREAKRGSEQA